MLKKLLGCCGFISGQTENASVICRAFQRGCPLCHSLIIQYMLQKHETENMILHVSLIHGKHLDLMQQVEGLYRRHVVNISF